MPYLTETISTNATPKLKSDVEHSAKQLACKPAEFVRLALYRLVDQTKRARGEDFKKLLDAVQGLDYRDAIVRAHFAFRKDGEELGRFADDE